jgi:hypothetical protein
VKEKEVTDVDVGQKVLIKQHLTIDAVPYGPGTYEVKKDEEAEPGNSLTAAEAKRATSKKSNAEVVEEKSNAGGVEERPLRGGKV